MGVHMTVVNGMVEVSGWASDPFLLTEASARKSLERVRSRRKTYATPEEFARHEDVYVKAMRLAGWAVPADPDAVVPSPPPPPPATPVPAEPKADPATETMVISIRNDPSSGNPVPVVETEADWLTRGLSEKDAKKD